MVSSGAQETDAAPRGSPDGTRSQGCGTPCNVARIVPYLAPDGTAGAPSLSFASDTNTGFYHTPNPDEIDVSTGGNVRWRWDANGWFLTNSGLAIGTRVSDGTAGAPTYGFVLDSDTGFFRPSGDTIGFATAGVEQWRMDSNGNLITMSDNGVFVAAGAANAPRYSFQGDADTGLYSVAADNVGFTAGGTLRFDYNATRLLFSSGYDAVLNTGTGPSAEGSIGFRGAPVNAQSGANYTLVLADSGKTIYHDEATARTWTIPANGSVAFPLGATIILDNTGNSGAAGAITLQITTDTLRRGDGTAGTGQRTIAASAVAVIRKTKTTEWVITGTFT